MHTRWYVHIFIPITIIRQAHINPSPHRLQHCRSASLVVMHPASLQTLLAESTTGSPAGKPFNDHVHRCTPTRSRNQPTALPVSSNLPDAPIAFPPSPCPVCLLRLLQPCEINQGREKKASTIVSSIGVIPSRTNKAALLRHIASRFCIHTNNTITTTTLACISSVPAPVLTMSAKILSLHASFLSFISLPVQSSLAPHHQTNVPRTWPTHHE